MIMSQSAIITELLPSEAVATDTLGQHTACLEMGRKYEGCE